MLQAITHAHAVVRYSVVRGLLDMSHSLKFACSAPLPSSGHLTGALRNVTARQFFIGTKVEYLPLSLVRDTCAVKVDRRDDVHSKQRVGNLPKPLRWGDTNPYDPESFIHHWFLARASAVFIAFKDFEIEPASAVAAVGTVFLQHSSCNALAIGRIPKAQTLHAYALVCLHITVGRPFVPALTQTRSLDTVGM